MGDATGAYVLAPGAAELRWMGETSTYFLATGEQTGEGFALVDERAMRGESVPLHVHRDDVESFYVLEGEITFYLDDGPGACAGAARSCTCRRERFTASGSSRRPLAT
jgi:quercetin dioxygenase-like cupin family protein